MGTSTLISLIVGRKRRLSVGFPPIAVAGLAWSPYHNDSPQMVQSQGRTSVDGTAFHLYAGKIDAMSAVHQAHPDKNLYFTEQWIGAPGDLRGDLAWHTRELTVGASRNWSRAVLEWNLA